jgi:actin-related protein 2
VFPSVVGRKASLGGEKGATLFGFDAINAKEELQINYPVKSAVITEWWPSLPVPLRSDRNARNDMTSLWKYTFRQALRVNPEERRVLLTEPIENPKMHREKMTEIMFERLRSNPYNLVAQGHFTGLR